MVSFPVITLLFTGFSPGLLPHQVLSSCLLLAIFFHRENKSEDMYNFDGKKNLQFFGFELYIYVILHIIFVLGMNQV